MLPFSAKHPRLSNHRRVWQVVTTQASAVTIMLFVLWAFSVPSFADSPTPIKTNPPLVQARNGLHDSEITCPAATVLVFKAEDLSPACVRHSSALGLMQRGWALDDQNLSSASNVSARRDYSLAFLGNAASPLYNSTIDIIRNHLQPGDYIIVDGIGVDGPGKKVRELRSLVAPGVNVGAIAIYNNIKSLTGNMGTLGPGFDYIGYDYEKGDGFSPEFTTNETSSIAYFDSAKKAVEQYNSRTGGSAKLLIMPPFGELRGANWDWGKAAKTADMIDIQLQAYVKDPKFFNYTLDAIAQIKKEAPSTKTFVQISLIEKRGTASDNLIAINEVRHMPIDGFFMFFHPRQISELTQFLQIMPP